jgi:hypothetical protein
MTRTTLTRLASRWAFIMSIEVVTGVEIGASPDLMQPGYRKWVTVIQSVCIARYATPLFIIYKGRVYISAWYEEIAVLRDWKLSISGNGWMNNTLGLEYLKHFDAHTKTREVEVYRLLILDGHESHPSQDFKNYCLEYEGPILEGLKAITLSDDFDDMSEEEQY